jgi:parallel beta-helix repeat protein
MLLNELLKERRKGQEQDVRIEEQQTTITELKSILAQQRTDLSPIPLSHRITEMLASRTFSAHPESWKTKNNATKGNQVMKISYISSVVIGLISLLTCTAQATCIEVNSVNTPGDATAVFVISQPGSYCLPTNVVGVSGKNGVRIDADNVTLDLSGFAMLGVSGSLNGILINTHFHIAIRNGSITGWGSNGLDGTAGALARIDDLRADTNAGSGLVINSGSQVNNCIAAQNGGVGITTSNDVLVTGCLSSTNGGHGFLLGTASTIKSSFANGNGGSGIAPSGVNSLTVIDCNTHFNTGAGIAGPKRALITSSTAEDNRAGGIVAGASSTISNCNASGNTGDGIFVSVGSAVTGCTASANTGDGIEVDNLSRVEGNTCQGNGVGTADGAGVHVTGRANRIDGNTAFSNDRGIDVDAGGNLIVRNDASLNTTNYDIVGGNPNANIETPGPNFILTRPWANFIH